MEELNSVTEWFNRLNQKWGEVPGAVSDRLKTDQLLELNDEELLALWTEIRKRDTLGERFNVRGWYHLLYQDVLKDKRVLDVGSGLGIDGITFAQNGARITFVDIVETNLSILRRLCTILNLSEVDFCYLKDIDSLINLDRDYDAIWCQGSLINAPFEVVRVEAQELLKHLKPGGRWIELAYPKARWEREGKLSFQRWGERTDGPGTPWVEWYDLEKILARLSPVEFDVVLCFNFHNDDFVWFDLVKR